MACLDELWSEVRAGNARLTLIEGERGSGKTRLLRTFINRAASDGGAIVLQSLAHEAMDDMGQARIPLQRALALAEPEGYVRIFVDEGAPMAVLLQAAARQGIAPDYSRQLLAALGPAPAGPPAKQPLIEPLSDRELEVLRLLGSDLSGPEIAGALMVSLNTMNTHTKNIYAKLGVNNRRAAVRRAAELHLL